MSQAHRGPGGIGCCWRPLLVVLALLGLLWMHALGTHGTVEPPAPGAHAAHQDLAAADGGDSGSGDHGEHGVHVMAAGLCLALLLVVVLLPGRWRRGLLLRLRAAASTLPARLVRPTPRARPPDLVSLGICRC